MKISNESEKGLKINLLKKIRLLLIALAVVLAFSATAVYFVGVRDPKAAEEDSEEDVWETEDHPEDVISPGDNDIEEQPKNKAGGEKEESIEDEPEGKESGEDDVQGGNAKNPVEANENNSSTEDTKNNPPATGTKNNPPTEDTKNNPPAEEPEDKSPKEEPEDNPPAEEPEDNPPVDEPEDTPPAEEPEKTPSADDTETPTDNTETPADNTETPAVEPETPADNAETPAAKPEAVQTEDAVAEETDTQTADAESQDEELGSAIGDIGKKIRDDAETSEEQEQDLEESDSGEDEQGQKNIANIIFVILCSLFGLDLAAIVGISIAIMMMSKKMVQEPAVEQYEPTCIQDTYPAQESMGNTPVNSVDERPVYNSNVYLGSLHHIGARPYQEDSLGSMLLADGCMAIVADGMGGLSAGDKVSQKIVSTMLTYGKRLQDGQMDGVLEAMVNGVNEEVNHMLGPDGIYKSGSTLLAVLVRQNRFHWITVGDSRIYFYRNGNLTKLNQEHNVGQDLLMKAARGEISYSEAKNAPKKNRVTSFIGMGNLRYIDRSIQSIALEPGDRIVLMTDGVFNALSDYTIASVLNQCTDVKRAAAEMERLVIQKGSPKQDNFTAIILGF